MAAEALAVDIVLSHTGNRDRAHIVVLDRDGSRRRIATEVRAADPEWAPDRSRVAYWGAQTYDAGFEQVTVVGRSGSGKRRITGIGWMDPSWSPDGEWVAATCNRPPCGRPRGLYRIDPDHPRRKIRIRGTRGAFDSAWAPGGERIVFVEETGGNSELYVKRFGRRTLRRLTRSDVDEARPDWSPDGRWIAYSRPPRRPNQPHDLWLVSPDGDRRRRLTRTMASETDPAWSPSGNRILFSTPRGFFSIRSDGTDRRRIPGFRQGDCCADW